MAGDQAYSDEMGEEEARENEYLCSNPLRVQRAH